MARLTKRDIFKILDSGTVSVTNAQAIKGYINHLLTVGANQEKKRGVRR